MAMRYNKSVLTTSKMMFLSHHRSKSLLSIRRFPAKATRTFSTSETQQRVETNIDSKGICHVVLNRPDKLNAVDLAMFEAIAETAANLRNDRSIRAVILRGKGRAFCTGLDVVRTIQTEPLYIQ
jgi:1,4-dihydroxy-2-naphthoyl-CoA synthase